MKQEKASQEKNQIDPHTKTIEQMTDEELEDFLKSVQERRKKGFERKPRKKNPLANLTPEALAEVLKRLEEN